MARVFVTGSSTGLGLMAGELLVEQAIASFCTPAIGPRRGRARALPRPRPSSSATSRASRRAKRRRSANKLGRFDAIIHNAGVGYREAQPTKTEDGLPHVFAINVLAPYILTALIERPDRLVYLSSGMHRGARADLGDLAWRRRAWDSAAAYAESKLRDVLIAFAFARRWPGVLSNAVDPGWVATRMGGASAPDDPDQGHRTQVWLAVSDEPQARVTGKYFHHLRAARARPADGLGRMAGPADRRMREAFRRGAAGLTAGAARRRRIGSRRACASDICNSRAQADPCIVGLAERSKPPCSAASCRDQTLWLYYRK